MEWKNQITKTPYLVLFVILISVGVGTASALITITLAGNVIITDDLTVDTNTLFVDSSTDRAGIGTTTPDSALHVVGGGSDNTPNKQGIQLTGSDVAGNVGIELTGDGKIPYIDFQNDIDNTDFDARIILRGNDTLSIEGADLEVSGDLSTTGTIECANCILGFYKIEKSFTGTGIATDGSANCNTGDVATGAGYQIPTNGEPPYIIDPQPDFNNFVFQWISTVNGGNYKMKVMCADFPPVHIP